MEHNPDLILVQETRLSTQNSAYIANYKCYHTPRPQNGTRCSPGGTAVYVKSTIPHLHLPNSNAPSIEHTNIKICLPSQPEFLVVSTYVRHNQVGVANDLKTLIGSHPITILAGDFNAHHPFWNCRRRNRYGDQVFDFISTNPDVQIAIPPRPTRIDPRSGSANTIDFALLRSVPFHHDLSVIESLDSDHYPILLSLFLNMPPPPLRGDPVVNWNKFRHYLSNLPPMASDFNSTSDIDFAVQSLHSEVTHALDISTTYQKKDTNPELPYHIKILIRERNRTRKNWQNSRDPAIKRRLNNLNHDIRRKIYQFRQTSWHDFCANLSVDDQSIWRYSKKLRNPYNATPPLKYNGDTAYTDKAKAEMLADCYKTQFEPHMDTFCKETMCEVDETVQNFRDLPTITTIEPTSPEEVQDCVNKLNNRKSPGIDKISNFAIKKFPANIIAFISLIINAMFIHKFFPSEWKTAVIVGIHKPGSKDNDPTNYRPISLLPCISKIAERLMLNRLQSFLNENNIVTPYQFGFRAKHSTCHQLLRVVEYASTGLKDKIPTGAFFADIAKAFDKVWHKGLIFKLIKMGIPDSMVHFFISYLYGRKYVVRVGKELSTPRIILSSVVQGSILGPTLFNLYINDIPTDPNIELALYADDTCVLARDQWLSVMISKLQNYINSLLSWFQKWRIKLNPTKCHFVYFSLDRLPPPPIYLNAHALYAEKSVKYLGVTIDNHLTWKTHITNTINKTNMVYSMLSPIFSNPNISLHNKMILFKGILRPVLLYGAQIWGFASKSNMKDLEAKHSRCLHSMCNVPKYVRNTVIRRTLRINTLKSQIKKQSNTFYSNLPTVPNELVFNIDDYDFRDAAHRKRPRAVLLLD